MSVSINWGTSVINVPKDYLNLVTGVIYSMDCDQFRLDLKALEDNEYGITYLKTHEHETQTLLAGITYARKIRILDPYTITFEDGQYRVELEGANTNIIDVANVNQVSIVPKNSAGLQIVTQGSGVTPEDKTDIASLVWDEPLTGATHNIATSSGRRLRALGDTIPGSVNDVSPTTTGFITNLVSSYTDFYSNQYIRFNEGNLEGQVRIVTKYNPATQRLCICGAEPFSVAPANGDEFDLIPVHIHPVKETAYFTWEELLDAHMTPTTFGYLQELVRQLREGNIYYEFKEATSQNLTRNVDSGVVDRIIVKYKKDSEVNWSGSGVITDTLYLWYKTLGDTDPIFVKESD